MTKQSNITSILVMFILASIIAMPSPSIFAWNPVSSTVTLDVQSVDMSGNEFSGQWVELWQNDQIIEENFTPFTTDVQSGQDYQVYIYDDPNENKFFDHWADGNTDQKISITPSEDTSLTAFFQTSTTEDTAPTNNPPVAQDDQAQTEMNTPVEIGVLNNDSDPDGDGINIDSIDSAPDNGDATITQDDTIMYTPSDGFTGQDSFTYIISDTNGATAEATVTIDVVSPPENQPPVAVDDNAQTPENFPVNIDVLANDSDPDGDSIFIDSIATDPMHGHVIISPDMTIEYIPDLQFTGEDNFQYVVSDINGATAIGLVTVNVG